MVKTLNCYRWPHAVWQQATGKLLVASLLCASTSASFVYAKDDQAWTPPALP